MRGWLFTPKVRCADLAKLNAHLAARCLQLARERNHPEQTSRKIIEVWDQECAALRAMPVPFDCYAEGTARISQTCLVNFERNRYSVDCRFASPVATVRAYAERIGTGIGKSHLATALARHVILQGKRARFCGVVDLVNQLDAEKRAGAPGT